MPLVHLRLPFRAVGSRVHSVPQSTITLICSELLCPLSPVNVTADTPILVRFSFRSLFHRVPPLGMRPLLRTTCDGKEKARGAGAVNQFST